MNSADLSLKDQEIIANPNNPRFSQMSNNELEERERKNRLPVLDGVRAIACLGVLSYHLHLMTHGAGIWGNLYDIHTMTDMLAYFGATLGYAGDSGVILFFLLSGFLLFLPYTKALLFDSPWPSFYCYYCRRIFRILPGYYVALFLLILIFNRRFLYPSHLSDLLNFLTFNMNHNLADQVNGPFWTLAIEFQFYLLLPIVAWLCSLIVRRGSLQQRLLKLTLCLLGIVTWGLLTRYWGLFVANTSTLDFLIPHPVSVALIPYLYSDTGKYYEVFGVGMLVSMIYTYLRDAPDAEAWRTRMHRLSLLLFTVGLVFLFLLSICYFYFNNINLNVYNYTKDYSNYIENIQVFSFLDSHIPIIVYSYWPLWQALAYAIGYSFCLIALLCGSPRLKRPFEWSVLSWVASISFSFYMWHQPLLGIGIRVIRANIQYQGVWGPIMQYAALWFWIFTFIVPISAALYYWVEKPGMSLGERFMPSLRD